MRPREPARNPASASRAASLSADWMVARVVYEVAAVIRHTSKIGRDPQGGQAAIRNRCTVSATIGTCSISPTMRCGRAAAEGI